MRNYIILNGQNSNSISGLLIQSLAPISKPQMRTQIEEIDGRPGDIVTDLGFSSYDKEITIGLYGNFDINEVIAYFNSQGVVTFSNEPDKYYNYQIYDQIDFERLVRYRTATVTMHCQPFKYSTIEQPDIMTPTDNLLTISNWTRTSNGVTITAKDGTITVSGTPTAATEFYLPINALTLPAGMFTLTATASGQNPNYCSIRMIGSAPSDSDSFGGKYITLVQGTTTLSATLSASKTYNYIWFYMNAGTPLNFTLNLSVEDEAAKVVSDEGTNLVLEGSQLAPFNTLDLKGNTEQQTYSGKNLIGFPNMSGTSNGITYSIIDGLITLNGTATARVDLPATRLFNISEGDKTFSIIPVSGTWSAGTIGIRAATASDTQITYQQQQSGGTRQNGTYNYSADQVSSIVKYNIYAPTNSAFSNYKFYIQLTSGTTIDQDYQPYVGGTAAPNPDYPQAVQTVTGENVVKICGKNLLDVENNLKASDGGLNFSYSNDKLVVSGTPTRSYANVTNEINTFLAAGQYTLSLSEAVSHRVYIWVRYTDGVAASLGIINAGGTSVTTTFAKDVAQIRLDFSVITTGVALSESFSVQLEKGSSSSSFEPYQGQSYPISLGSIELCNIPGTDYRDRFISRDGKWWLHKEIGKITFTSTTAWTKHSTTNGNVFMLNNTGFIGYGYGAGNAAPALMDTARVIKLGSMPDSANGVFGINDNSQLRVFRGAYDASYTADTFKAEMVGHYIYGALATPTDTEITNEALIEQLDDIYYHAHAYKGRTHITSSAATGNVPHIIAAAVAQNNDGVVTNSGNYFSKPRLTIYGEGEIGVYLNGIQIFQIALGSEGYITIDTAALEAYKDTTDNLKNRLVTGDYENFALRPGENQLSFSGSVTKCVVENYSRWL